MRCFFSYHFIYISYTWVSPVINLRVNHFFYKFPFAPSTVQIFLNLFDCAISSFSCHSFLISHADFCSFTNASISSAIGFRSISYCFPILLAISSFHIFSLYYSVLQLLLLYLLVYIMLLVFRYLLYHYSLLVFCSL